MFSNFELNKTTKPHISPFDLILVSSKSEKRSGERVIYSLSIYYFGRFPLCWLEPTWMELETMPHRINIEQINVKLSIIFSLDTSIVNFIFNHKQFTI